MDHSLLRKKIIGISADCFLKYGIKSTSMSFISETLRISKRTLYQLFPGKRHLLEACVAFRLEASRKGIERQCGLSGPVEAIVRMNYGAYAFSRAFCPAFRKDVARHAALLALFDEKYRIPLCEMCSGLFDDAKTAGLILPESSFEFAFRFFESTLLAAPSGPCDEKRQAKAYSHAILTYLAGICTDEGRNHLKNIPMKIRYENEKESI